MFGKFKYINMENLSMSQPNLGQKKAPQNMMKIFLLDFIFLKIFFLRGGKGGRKRVTETVCDCLSCTSYWEPRHVPWWGTEPTTLWVEGRCSIHWATPARAYFYLILNNNCIDEVANNYTNNNWLKTGKLHKDFCSAVSYLISQQLISLS